MQDVAERAGVSVATVSHVINKTRPVSEELQARVSLAMDDLGYQPNLLARSLRRGKTFTIGMIVPDSANPFFAEIARGVEDLSYKQGYSIILCNTDNDIEKEIFNINVLVEKRVDGILFIAAGMSAEHVHSLQERGMPVVIADREIPGVEVDSVFPDNAHGGWRAVRHLIDLGHKRIGCITGPSDLTPSAERVTGYRQALGEAGLNIDEAIIVKGDFQYDSGYRVAEQLLTLNDPPTAIFACNDLMGIGAISAAWKLNRQVPGDLSIIGFDNIRLASFTVPPLTTIEQPIYDMGELAITMLLERIREPELPPRRQVLETNLLIRNTTAAPGEKLPK